uniref:Uncharacterized protein n=1 Tax=Caenorhabditis japonica TaxID=281687 RepID=A0A8R1EVU9_CAEJA
MKQRSKTTKKQKSNKKENDNKNDNQANVEKELDSSLADHGDGCLNDVNHVANEGENMAETLYGKTN